MSIPLTKRRAVDLCRVATCLCRSHWWASVSASPS